MKSIQSFINHLSQKDQDFILARPGMIQDIIEQQLDKEEIENLMMSAHFVEEQKTKQQITIKIPVRTLKRIKIKAKKEGLPYQTYLNSLLYKFVS